MTDIQLTAPSLEFPIFYRNNPKLDSFLMTSQLCNDIFFSAQLFIFIQHILHRSELIFGAILCKRRVNGILTKWHWTQKPRTTEVDIVYSQHIRSHVMGDDFIVKSRSTEICPKIVSNPLERRSLGTRLHYQTRGIHSWRHDKTVTMTSFMEPMTSVVLRLDNIRPLWWIDGIFSLSCSTFEHTLWHKFESPN